MSFVWPGMLLSLLLLPLFAALIQRGWRRRRELALRFGPASGAREARPVPAWLLLAGLAVLALAAARPQAEIGVPRLEGRLMLAFDVSGSMAADDLKPSRIEAARAAARLFVERQPPSVQIGVVSFSDGGFVVQRPTGDRQAILATLARLSPQRATSLGRGIEMALKALAPEGAPADPAAAAPLPAAPYASELIVLISDGENTSLPDPLEAVQLAVERGVRVYTVGVGTAAGATLTIDGFRIHTALDEAMLRQIADQTGGAYFSLQAEEDLGVIYDVLTPRLTIRPEKAEVTAVLAGLSAALMLAGGALSLMRYGRLP